VVIFCPVIETRFMGWFMDELLDDEK